MTNVLLPANCRRPIGGGARRSRGRSHRRSQGFRESGDCQAIAKSDVLLDIDDNARRMIGVDPPAVLDGSTPRLINEWKLEPAIWNLARKVVDRRSLAGQFILTGSTVSVDDATRHTGAGRFARLRMRPLSLYESGYRSGEISLQKPIDGEDQRARRADISIASIAKLTWVVGLAGIHLQALEGGPAYEPGLIRRNPPRRHYESQRRSKRLD